MTGSVRSTVTMDDAWRAAEQAAGDRWRIESIERSGINIGLVGGRTINVGLWTATALGPFDHSLYAEADSPTFALLALADKLRSVSEDTPDA